MYEREVLWIWDAHVQIDVCERERRGRVFGGSDPFPHRNLSTVVNVDKGEGVSIIVLIDTGSTGAIGT